MKKNMSILTFGIALVLLIVLSACLQEDDSSTKEKIVRIGYQKNCPFVILKGLGTLEEALEPLGYEVEWKLFQEGPELTEALNAGSIDIGRTGNTPVVFAQAAKTPFVTLAAGAPKFNGSGILVPEDSTITSVEDLQNQRISFAKGSSSHYLLVKALEEAGIDYGDIEPALLPPGEARVAFEKGNVDAMVVWDPFTASTELFSNGRLLITGEGLTTDRDFFVATQDFVENHKEIADIVIEEVDKSSQWANDHHEELVQMLAPILDIDEMAIEKAVERREYGVDDITADIISEQQDIADTLSDMDIIPEKMDVREVMEY